MAPSLDSAPGEHKVVDRPGSARAPLPSVRVVLFSGGRGSGVLSRLLLKSPNVRLTLAINGYDDGASTGAVRRFLGDSLGPSDFRKNASRVAGELGTCPAALIEMLDARLPDGISREDAIAHVRQCASANPGALDRVEAFLAALATADRPFSFNDCSVGNLVFAGCFLRCGRHFNLAVDDYCALVGLPPGLVENVTSGENAHLVALSEDGVILGSEEEIVATAGRNKIRDIYLVDRAMSEAERERLRGVGPEAIAGFFEGRRQQVTLNPRLAVCLAEADLIIYAPGTQHSSLFPSYMTPGLGGVIARNLKAIKLLITNIQTDAEILGASAVDIIGRALYYLTEKGAQTFPTPCLITHYVVNDPARAESSAPYVPLGQIEALEDPRLVRIANYEEGVSGRHDAAKILAPFIRSLVEKRERQRLAVLLSDAGSPSKVTQTLLEMVRGGMSDVPVDVTVFHEGGSLDRPFVDSLPFGVTALTDLRTVGDLLRGGFDYVLLFESSGMYRGEDIVVLASHLSLGRLDAVWGSRRLSVRDIEESIRFRYEKSPFFGALSRTGSHALSMACLLLYGRYVSDTLSAVRAVRVEDAMAIDVGLMHPRVNQHLLARLLRRKADLLEIPVQFFPISPERVKRTSVAEGLKALAALLRGRLAAPRTGPAVAGPEADERRTTPLASR